MFQNSIPAVTPPARGKNRHQDNGEVFTECAIMRYGIGEARLVKICLIIAGVQSDEASALEPTRIATEMNASVIRAFGSA